MIRTLRSFEPKGTVRVQPSKSILHRALICAALSKGVSKVSNYAPSQDIEATIRVLKGLGLARFEIDDEICVVRGGLHEQPAEQLDCGESGTTLRLIFPLALDGEAHMFVGAGRLMDRPFGPYKELCAAQRILLERNGHELYVRGKLRSASVSMPGNVSSQFISGLLLGFSQISGTSQIELTTQLESAPYVDLTCDTMNAFGGKVWMSENGFSVQGPQAFRPCEFIVEGDYSHAAFFAVAGAIAGEVTLEGLRRNSRQGDRAILEILENAGARIEWNGSSVTVSRDVLQPIEIDVSQIPDLVPVLAVLACAAKGHSVLYNAARLRLKESDRLSSMKEELTKLGVLVNERTDALEIDGTGRLHGGTANAQNDHRVAMALTVASLISDEPVLIEGSQCVNKSAPLFFEEWQLVGGT